MKTKKIWTTIEIIAILIFAVLLILFGWRKYQDYNYLKEQENFKDKIKVSEIKVEKIQKREDKNELAIKKVEELRKDHPAIIGIIEIPGTNIIYPVVQGEDNWFYLNHDKDGNYHTFGEVFLDSRNDMLFGDRNSVIYGHNIRQAKTIFHELLNYSNQDFYEEHKYINIYSLDGYKKYEVISVFQADPEEPYRERDFVDIESYKSFIEKYNEKSLVLNNYKSYKDLEDRSMITLSTCFDNTKRMVIQAIETK